MREIEVLVRLFSDKSVALKKLSGFKHCKTERIVDTYYFHPKLSILRPEKSGRFRDCLRIRTKANETLIAFKKDHFDKNDIWQYSDEHETTVGDPLSILEILNALGFEKLIVVDNTKHKYLHGNYEIVLEDVKNLGLFLEVEYKKNSKSSHRRIKEDILAFIRSLNLKFEELNLGKPELIYRKMNSKKS